MVFITGATGLLGSRLVAELWSKGEKIYAFTRNLKSSSKILKGLEYYTPNAQEIFQSINWIEGEITDTASYEHYLSSETYVYHCAAMVSFNQKDNKIIHETNVGGTTALVNICLEKNVRKFCLVSSIAAVGGHQPDEYLKEQSVWDPTGRSTYSLSKHGSEMEVWRGVAEGLNAVIVNPGVILGAGDWDSGSLKIIKMIAKGTPFYTKGVTGYVDVEDVARAMVQLMASDISARRFVLCSENYSYEELFKELAGYLGSKIPSIYAKPWVTEIAWRLTRLASSLSSKSGQFTKNTARSSHQVQRYDGSEITRQIPFEYTPLSATLKFIANCFSKQ